MALFESYERRINQIIPVLTEIWNELHRRSKSYL